MRFILFLLLGIIWLQAETIDGLIDKSLRHHRSLESIKLRLSAGDAYIAKSRNFENPTLSFTINDIQFADITDRSLEPMQWSAVKVKQKFPWFGKRDAKMTYERAKKMFYFIPSKRHRSSSPKQYG